jgi:hypothetical protein
VKKFKIAILEVGMIGGIILAGYSLPGNTRLSVFLVASGLFFAAGNIFLFRLFKQTKGGEGVEGGKAWPHTLRAIAIVTIVWLLVLLLSKR